MAKRLYIARWPDGTAWLVRARNLAEVAGILDEEGDPGAAEVSVYDGPLVLELRPPKDRADGPRLEVGWASCETAMEAIDSLMSRGFPLLQAAVERAEAADRDLVGRAWRASRKTEATRGVETTPGWSEAVTAWWEGFSRGRADRTAALRDAMDVSIPGEPKPETPRQRKLFEEAQRKMMEGIFAPPTGTPNAAPAKKRAVRPRKKRTPRS